MHLCTGGGGICMILWGIMVVVHSGHRCIEGACLYYIQ